jgi:hypothetical protein
MFYFCDPEKHRYLHWRVDGHSDIDEILDLLYRLVRSIEAESNCGFTRSSDTNEWIIKNGNLIFGYPLFGKSADREAYCLAAAVLASRTGTPI